MGSGCSPIGRVLRSWRETIGLVFCSWRETSGVFVNEVNRRVG